VREWAWLGVRDHVADEIDVALHLLEEFTHEEDEYLRRFASEVSRPRGVWSKHIRSLRLDPTPGLRIISHLRGDPSRYVQLSVGNWLNDAARDHPEWTESVCMDWLKRAQPGQFNAVEHVCRRGLRSLRRLSVDGFSPPGRQSAP
jgi:3-methyladenine DNA glycosylase AlkC